MTCLNRGCVREFVSLNFSGGKNSWPAQVAFHPGGADTGRSRYRSRRRSDLHRLPDLIARSPGGHEARPVKTAGCRFSGLQHRANGLSACGRRRGQTAHGFDVMADDIGRASATGGVRGGVGKIGIRISILVCGVSRRISRIVSANCPAPSSLVIPRDRGDDDITNSIA